MKTKMLIVFLFAICSLHAQTIEWVSSTNAKPWQKQKEKEIKRVGQSEQKIDINVSENKAQYIDGFGGCFNEMGWDALMTLPETEREKVMQNLFTPGQSNYSYCRMPIGASDYGLGFYSLNDIADDYKMVNFNIHRDRYILLPYIKSALKIRPDMKLFASPWSPPAWMKTNNHYAGNSNAQYNGMPDEKILEASTTAFRMERGMLQAYALYFTKFVQAYEKEGVTINSIHVQNEPCSPQTFPSCNWRSQDLTFFIGEFLGPKFEQENIKTDIYFGTINTSDLNYTRSALTNKKAAQYIKGVG